MGNGLKVTMTPDEFSGLETEEKLDLIFQAVSVQQLMCTTTVESFKDRLGHCEDMVQSEIALPRRNRRIDLGVGAGTGVIGGGVMIKIIDLIKGYITGS